MTAAMAAQVVVLCAAVATFGSFFWAMKRFFTKPDGATRGMQAIYVLGTLFTLLHLGLILLHFRFEPLAASGALALYGAALGVFWWAVQVNRRRPLSFAFSADRPQHLVMEGPYRFVRHPFYSAYTLAWIAGALAVPEPWLLASAAVMFGLYRQAAMQEEIKFAGSELAGAYAAYQSRTGMFLPRLGGVRKAA